jgi:hypothetical protein
VYFILQNAIRRPFELPDMVAQSFGNAHREGQPVLPIDRARLTLMLKEGSSGIGGSITYNKALFAADNLKHWIANYKTILAKVVSHPDMSLGRLADHLG